MRGKKIKLYAIGNNELHIIELPSNLDPRWISQKVINLVPIVAWLVEHSDVFDRRSDYSPEQRYDV